MLTSTSLRALRVAAPRLRSVRFASHEAPHFNEPSGYLFGEKVLTSIHSSYEAYPYLYLQPVPPGQKRVKEDWENIWYIGMYGSMLFAAVMLYYKPDTRCACFKACCIALTLALCVVYRLGLWKRPSGGWRNEERSTSMSHLHPHLLYPEHTLWFWSFEEKSNVLSIYSKAKYKIKTCKWMNVSRKESGYVL